jgi:hypothetical protein
MTINSISLQKSNLGEINTINAIIFSSGLLINSTTSLGNVGPTIKIYEMLGCATIL